MERLRLWLPIVDQTPSRAEGGRHPSPKISGLSITTAWFQDFHNFFRCARKEKTRRTRDFVTQDTAVDGSPATATHFSIDPPRPIDGKRILSGHPAGTYQQRGTPLQVPKPLQETKTSDDVPAHKRPTLQTSGVRRGSNTAAVRRFQVRHKILPIDELAWQGQVCG